MLSIPFKTEGREKKNDNFGIVIFHVQIFQTLGNLEKYFGTDLNKCDKLSMFLQLRYFLLKISNTVTPWISQCQWVLLSKSEEILRYRRVVDTGDRKAPAIACGNVRPRM